MASAETDMHSPPPPSPASDGRRWHGHAFGMALDSGFPARGLFDGPPTGHARRTSLDLASLRAVEAAWSRNDALRLRDLRDAEGRRLLTIEEHAEFGYLLDAPGYGRYLVSGDATRILCAPSRVPRWQWQAFLIGQILPLAAVLHGLEALHASAVALRERGIALVGHSHGGKSSLAVNLARRGAAFLTDDVLVLERREEHILGHPGAALTSVRHAEARVIGPAALERLGKVVGRDERELRVAVEREQRALPLGAIYFIERRDHELEAAVESLSPAQPRLLLGSTFNGFVRAPERLISQLDLCARIARTVPTFRAIISPGMDAQTLAGSIESHALSVIGNGGRLY